MAKKKKAAAAAGAVAAARTNPYVQRVVEDDDLRDNVRVAFEAARDAYDRLTDGKAPQKVIMEDKKFRRDLQTAAEALRDGFGRKLLFVAVAAGAAIALSSDLRAKLLDALFGAEEEFEYTSTTTPNAASAAPTAAAAT